MTPQEAIDYLLDPIGKRDQHDEAIRMAIEALEKQIPRPVKRTVSTKRCGSCGRQLSGIGNLHPERKYCQRCGQAIDWAKPEQNSR